MLTLEAILQACVAKSLFSCPISKEVMKTVQDYVFALVGCQTIAFISLGIYPAHPPRMVPTLPYHFESRQPTH